MGGTLRETKECRPELYKRILYYNTKINRYILTKLNENTYNTSVVLTTDRAQSSMFIKLIMPC